MPTAILVREAIVGKGRQRLWRIISRPGLARLKLSPRKLFRLGDIDPILSGSVAIKLNAIRIMQTGHVWSYFRKFSRLRIRTVEYVYDTTLIVGQVVHVRYKNAAVGRLCKK